MIIAFLIHILFLSAATVLVLALLYHYRRYAPPHDSGLWVNSLFLAAIMGLGIISTVLFLLVPWGEINIRDANLLIRADYTKLIPLAFIRMLASIYAKTA